MTAYREPPRGASPSGAPIRLWQAVLDRLQVQTPKATFDTWLAETRGVSLEADTLTVAGPTAFGVAWLEGRMQGLADTTASAIASREIRVRFVLQGSMADEVVELPARKAEREPRRSTDPKASEQLREGLAVAVDELSLDPLHKAVLDRLTRYVDDRGKTWVGQKRLAEELNVGVKAVRRALRNLAEWGYISIVARFPRRADGTRRQSSNMYTIARWLCRQALQLLDVVREGMRKVRRAVSWVQAKAQGAGRPGRLKGGKVPAGRFLDRYRSRATRRGCGPPSWRSRPRPTAPSGWRSSPTCGSSPEISSSSTPRSATRR